MIIKLIFYKQIVFTPDCTLSGATSPYTITQMDRIISQINTTIDTTQYVFSSQSGNGLDLLNPSTHFSKLISGSSISSGRMFNPGQIDDGQIQFDVDLSNYSDQISVGSTLAKTRT